jgi:hypothetical protein
MAKRSVPETHLKRVKRLFATLLLVLIAQRSPQSRHSGFAFVRADYKKVSGGVEPSSLGRVCDASGTLAISRVGVAFLAALIAEEGQPMTLAERCLVQAAECDRMSRITHDQTNKMLWRFVADTWRQCAELECENATKQRSRRARPTKEPLH